MIAVCSLRSGLSLCANGPIGLKNETGSAPLSMDGLLVGTTTRSRECDGGLLVFQFGFSLVFRIWNILLESVLSWLHSNTEVI